MRPVRDALAQLQIAYARGAGTEPTAQGGPGEAGGEGEAPAQPEEPSKPKPSGRLWVPPGSIGLSGF